MASMIHALSGGRRGARAFLYVCIFFALTASVAAQPCPDAKGKDCDRIWLLGTRPGNLPTNFRPFRLPGKTFIGVSGSAQPSLAAYQALDSWLLRKYRNLTYVRVYDLRQESHAFIEKMPVTWYLGRDQVNCEKTPDAIAKDEQARIDGLRRAGAATVYMSSTPPSDTACKAGTSPNKVSTLIVEAEAAIVSSIKSRVTWSYERLYVADFHAPTDAVVEAFVTSVLNLPKNRTIWLHFHCAAGDGRTTTFMAMAQMMVMADKESLEEILVDQRDVSPDGTNLCCYCKKQNVWKNDWARDRYWFLAAFHQYCKDQIKTGGSFDTPFSVWKTRNTVPAPPVCPNHPSCATNCDKEKTQGTCEDC